MANPTSTYQPDFITPPGDTIAELLEERGMTQSELAQRMGRPIKSINAIIHGKKILTAETALQLEQVLGTPASFWLNRERIYREHLARQVVNETLQEKQGWLNKFPIRDMQAKGLLPSGVDKSQVLVALLQFFGLAQPENWDDIWSSTLVRYRKSDVYESDAYALSVWLRQGELEAQEIYANPYDERGFTRLLHQEIRSLTRKHPQEFSPELVQLCASVGVAVTFIPQIAGAKVSGATRWLTKDKALIQLSLRYKTNDHFWFTFFHEAGHIICHGKRDVFIDMEGKSATNEREEEANKYARDTLIPSTTYKSFVQNNNKRLSKVVVNQFARDIDIAPGIVVGRLQHDEVLPYTHLNGFKETFQWVDE